jgi:hypothetical protein
MKTRNFILYILLAVWGFQSCDVTDRIPETDITDLTYWKKVDDLKAYARDFYPRLSAPPSGNAYPDNTSDITVPQGAPNEFFNSGIVPTGDDGWGAADWTYIRDANYFMTHYQTAEGDAADINHYVGEVRFFRANEYFNKVKRFGDVPWYEKDLQTNDSELLYKGRDPRLSVIGKVIEDLEFAANNMKLPSEVSTGQLHKYCAWQMLSRVCLFEASWQKYTGAAETVWRPLMEKAASAAKAVMDSKLYSIQPLIAEYNMEGYPLMYKGKFIQEDLTKDAECILPRVYVTGLLTTGMARNGSYGLSKDFIEQFLDIDGKPIALSGKYLGDNSIVSEVQHRDPRLWNIVRTRFMPLTIDINTGLPTSPEVEIPGGSGAEQNATGYKASKFQDPDPEQWNANSTTTDWYIFRYAETLLNYAEALCELGLCDQSVLDATVNQLRARLDYTDSEGKQITMGRLSANPPADPQAIVNGQPRYGYAISPLLYEIRRERCIELSFEGFRWDDICRWRAGKLIDNPKTMWGMVVNDDIEALYTANNGDTNPFNNSLFATITDWDGKTKKLLRAYDDALEARRKWDDKYYLSPLPQNQTTLNPALLPQNPGW